MKTQLNERILWFDGDVTVTSMNYLYNKLLKGEDISGLFVESITPEIEFYNKNSRSKLLVKEGMKPFSFEWNIPDVYKNLPLKKYILQLLEKEVTANKFTDQQIEDRINRVKLELGLWESADMTMLLKTLIYVVDQFKENNIVWGTGRGSSCCCYILYLIGLHDVDSIYYNLDIKEFFRD